MITWTLLLFIVASMGVLSVGHDHVLFWLPVEPKAPGSAPFSSTGEQVYLAFAALIGIASGPVQAASRTLLARMCPPEKITEFFGFFAFSGKITAFAAPFAIGVVTAATGSQRIGIATSILFFIAGLVLLQWVRAPGHDLVPEVAHAGEHHGEAGSSAAAMTSSSRIEPPGWITAVAPASAAACESVGEGKKASEAATEPCVSGLGEPAALAASAAFQAAMRAESTRLIWPAPMPTVAPSLA